MGIARDSRHKRSASGARRAYYRKKRVFELGRQPAMTKLTVGNQVETRIHKVRVRGGNTKHRAIRLNTGNFAWGSESVTRKVKIQSVKYNTTNNELQRTQTLVKGCVVQIDAVPFRQWYEAHYAQQLPQKAGAAPAAPVEETKKSNHVQRILAERKKDSKLEPALTQQLRAGAIYAIITSRPGQSGRADGYILEGEELQFYLKKLNTRKAKHAA